MKITFNNKEDLFDLKNHLIENTNNFIDDMKRRIPELRNCELIIINPSDDFIHIELYNSSLLNDYEILITIGFMFNNPSNNIIIHTDYNRHFKNTIRNLILSYNRKRKIKNIKIC